MHKFQQHYETSGRKSPAAEKAVTSPFFDFYRIECIDCLFIYRYIYTGKETFEMSSLVGKKRKLVVAQEAFDYYPRECIDLEPERDSVKVGNVEGMVT